MSTDDLPPLPMSQFRLDRTRRGWLSFAYWQYFRGIRPWIVVHSWFENGGG